MTARRTLALLAAAAVMVTPVTVDARVPNRSEAATLRLINEVRHQHGLRALHVRGDLYRAARSHSFDMARNGYFAHGAALARFLTFGGDGLSLFGENIAWGSGDQERPASAMERWLASAPHRANLLDPAWRFVGVGVHRAFHYQGADVARVYTVDFGA